MDLWVFLYSNYSPKCKQLIETMSANNIEIPFTMLCIDDKNLRERVKKSKDFSIKYVPCILNVNSTTGVASQYEGEKAFELIHSMIEPKETKTSIEEVIASPAPVQAPVYMAAPAQEMHTNIEDLFADDTEEEEVEEEVEEEIKPATPLKKKIDKKYIEDMKREREMENKIKIPSFNQTGVDLHSPPVPIESKKTGAPIKVSEVMARAGN